MSKGMIRPEEAHQKAQTMRNIADNMQTLLNNLQDNMNLIGDVSAGVDAGTQSATNAKASFEELMTKFPGFYEQIVKFSNNVDTVANTMVQQ